MSSVEKGARRADIDLLRGLAILFMVEAHVGATLAPSDLSTSAPLGLLAASIGGPVSYTHQTLPTISSV